MEKYILHSGIIAFIYILMKFVEMRMIKKDKKEVRRINTRYYYRIFKCNCWFIYNK